MSTSLESYKQQGKKQFAAKNFQNADLIYSEALNAYPEAAVLYSNRAMVRIKQSQWKNALNDCEKGLKATDTTNSITVKLLWRKATCLMHLSRPDLAEQSLLQARSLDPKNSAVGKDLELLQREKAKLIDIPIQEVQHLPPELSQYDTTTSLEDMDVDLDEELAGIEGVTVPKAHTTHTATRHPIIVSKSQFKYNDRFPEHPTVYFLSTLPKKVTAQHLKNYQSYVLHINTFQSLFKSTGVDSDFFQFYVDAALVDLQSPEPQYASKIAQDIELFTSLPRFMLTSMYIPSSKSSLLLKLILDQTGVDLRSSWL